VDSGEDTAAAVREGFERYRQHLRPEQVEQFSLYLQLLERWNQHINLTAIRERRMAVLRHFVEPALAARYLAGAGPMLLDVGSGAGIPGLPMKILDPDRDCVLVESSTKKATFLKEVVDALALEDVTVVNERFEAAIDAGSIPQPVHVLAARAWTGWGPLLGLAAPLMAPGGRALLFVGEATLRALCRNLSTGGAMARTRDRDWRRAARAGWEVKQADPLPHLDTGYLVSLELGR